MHPQAESSDECPVMTILTYMILLCPLVSLGDREQLYPPTRSEIQMVRGPAQWNILTIAVTQDRDTQFELRGCKQHYS